MIIKQTNQYSCLTMIIFYYSAELFSVIDWMLDIQKTPNPDKENLKIMMMKRIDANADGKLSLEEFTALYEEQMHIVEVIRRGRIKFTELDVDGSGFLEEPELEKVTNWMLKTRKSSADSKDITRDKTIEMLRAKMPEGHEGQAKMDVAGFLSLFEEVVAGIPLAGVQ